MSAAKTIPGTHERDFTPERITQHKVPGVLRQLNPFSTHLAVYTMGGCSIIVAREPAGLHAEMLWHLSISRTDRHPSWDEIKTVRYRLLPEALCLGMLLPPAEFYVNVEAQDHVFHLWEITDPREPWSGM